ncbi:MAG: tetratricopeptide repeat protein [Catalinimonas sp.]
MLLPTQLMAQATPLPRSAERWLATAEAHYRSQRWTDALDAADRAVALQHDLLPAYLLRAELRERSGDLDGALTDLTVAVHLDSAHREARLLRGRLAFDFGRYGTALDDFRYLLDHPGGTTHRMLYTGEVDADGTFRATGVSTLQSGMEAELHHWLARTYARRDQLDSAVVHFGAALRHNPRHADSYLHRGTAYELLGDTARALTDLEAALKLRPDHPTTLLNLTALARARHEGDRLARALHEAEESAEACLQRGILHLEADEWEAARRALDRALQLGGDPADVCFQRARARKKLGDADGALADLDRTLRHNPAFSEAYTNRGNLHFERGAHAAALVDYDRSLRYYPANGAVLYNRGLTLRALKRSGDACESLQRALDAGYTAARKPLAAWCGQ